MVSCLCQSQSLILKRETEREVSNTDSIRNREFMCWNIFCQPDLNYSLYFSKLLPAFTNPERW